tara:strand:+ start:399 stop:1382 length:984 start_codon:yes stop_codon:yes gene_type:complete
MCAAYTLDTPYSSEVIFLNSENAVFKSIDGIGEYTYSFNTPLQLPTNTDMLISVTDAQLPNIIPNVTADNNQISFYVPVFSKYFTVTLMEADGNVDRVYTVADWLSFVNAQIVIEASSQFSLYGEFQQSSSKIKWFSNYPFQIINTTNYPTTCIDLIGFARQRTNELLYVSTDTLLESTTNPSYHITMPSIINFAGTRYIFVKFDNITVPNLNSTGTTDNAMVRIDNNAAFGYYIFYRPMEIQRFIVRKRTIDNITFRLTNTKGDDINIWSADAQITIKIDYVYKPALRSMEEGTLQYELRKLSEVPKVPETIRGVYNPESNTFTRD